MTSGTWRVTEGYVGCLRKAAFPKGVSEVCKQIRLKMLELPDVEIIEESLDEAQKGHLAVPPFYFYRREDVKRIPEALAAGCGADAPGSFAAWLSRQVPMHAFVMPRKRYDVGDVESYRRVCRVFEEGGHVSESGSWSRG